MSQWHANIWSHPWSLSARSLHLTLVTKWSWSWSWMTYSHHLVQCQLALPFWDTAISKFDHENPWSRPCMCSQVKVIFDLENSKVKVITKVKHIGHIWGLVFNRYVCFSFHDNRTTFAWDIANSIFDLEKNKIKVMAKVKPNGHICGLQFNWYACFLFRGNRTIFGWDIANSILTMEIQSSRSWPRSNRMVTFEV